MDEMIVKKSVLPQLKKAARVYADNHLNWAVNANSLGSDLEILKNSSPASEILDHVRLYEHRRMFLWVTLRRLIRKGCRVLCDILGI